MLDPKIPTSSRSFLLRSWQERGASPSWRFMLEDVKSGQRRGFGSVASLLAFFEQEWGEDAPPTGPPWGVRKDGETEP